MTKRIMRANKQLVIAAQLLETYLGLGYIEVDEEGQALPP